MRTVLIVLMLTGTAHAEPTPLKWPAHHDLARWLSDGAVAVNLSADAARAWRSDHRASALQCEAIRIGVTLGASEAVKRIIHRERPDGSDNKSFYSMHTALAMQASGWRYNIGVPFAVGAGYFRMAANRHYLTDVMTGAVAGLLARRVCA